MRSARPVVGVPTLGKGDGWAPGDSSRAVVLRGQASLAQLRKRTQAVERFVEQFETSVTSEQALDTVLQGLRQCGWMPLPDRRSPTGGNIDELLVGPGGVAVLDAKTWSDAVRVQGDRLYGGRRRRTDHIERLRSRVLAVEAALDNAGLTSVPVLGFVVLTSESDRHFAPEEVQGVWVLGLDHVQLGFSNLPPRLSVCTVPTASSVLDLAFPAFTPNLVPGPQTSVGCTGRYSQPLRSTVVDAASDDDRVLDGELLEQALRRWRSETAKGDNVPAYVVMNDAELMGVAMAAPTTLEQLGQCRGIGPIRLERYGHEILAVIEGALA